MAGVKQWQYNEMAINENKAAISESWRNQSAGNISNNIQLMA